jgi:hypothetical protein
MTSLQIPRPQFQSCDETSLKLKWDDKVFETIKNDSNYEIKVQYKEVHEQWDQAKDFLVKQGVSHVILSEADVVDLKPGTPYYVRLAVCNKIDGSIQIGPETVFDTKPIDCTPKRKNCIIS